MLVVVVEMRAHRDVIMHVVQQQNLIHVVYVVVLALIQQLDVVQMMV